MSEKSKKVEELKKKLDNLKENYEQYECPGVALGNLYVLSTEHRVRIFKPTPEILKIHPSFIYDSNTGNVHLIPEDQDIAKRCSEIIIDKRKEIKENIKTLTKNNEDYESITLNARKGNNNSILNNTPYSNDKGLFMYISVTYKDTNYDLIFNRFFYDENEHVNCILLCFHIKIYSATGDEPLSAEYYPKEDDDKKDPDKCEYLDFPVSIEQPADEIAKAFLEFVINREDGKTANNTASE